VVEISFEGSKEIVSRPTASSLINNIYFFLTVKINAVSGGRWKVWRVFYIQLTEDQALSVL